MASARQMGDVGVKDREAQTRIETARLEMEATLEENTRKAQIAASAVRNCAEGAPRCRRR